jgi:hypothetical protein
VLIGKIPIRIRQRCLRKKTASKVSTNYIPVHFTPKVTRHKKTYPNDSLIQLTVSLLELPFAKNVFQIILRMIR